MRSFLALGVFMGTCVAAAASATPTPNVDKQKLATYLRYAEGISPNVAIQVDDPQPTKYAGFYVLNVHLSLGTHKEEHRYYITEDGQRVLSGNLWSLNESPFLETLSRLTPNGPAFGVPDAKVTIVVFSDFQCPYCQQLAKTLRANIPQKYPKDVRVVMKNYPIPAIHPWARVAAEAGACMADASTGAFWAYHDWVFEHQGDVNAQYQKDKDKFAAYLRNTAGGLAETQKVDAAKVKSCIDSHASADEVNKDIAEGDTLKVGSTPTFFINGRPIPGAISWDQLDTLIQLELNRPKDIAGPVAMLR